MNKLLVLAVMALGAQDAPTKRGFLGTSLLDDGGMLRVGVVVKDSPADKAGIAIEDRILKLDGAPVTTVAAFTKAMQERGAGGEVRLTVMRAGQTREVKITLAMHPQDALEEPDTSPGLLKVRKESDLAYGDHERHKLNLILPVRDRPFPTLLWIHAGAWSFGGRENETALGVRLAERGIGFAAISHRLTGGAWFDPKHPKEGVRHPAHVEDAARAFAWIRKNIKDRGGDPDRIFVAGHSSGAHLAALLAMDPRYLKAHGIEVTAVRGSIPIGGAYDLAKYHAHLLQGLGKPMADAHLDAIFGKPEDWAAASPATYVKELKVPMLVITEDDPGFQTYTADFKAVVPEGAPVEFWTAAERVHQDITAKMARKEPDEPRDKMIAFIRGLLE